MTDERRPPSSELSWHDIDTIETALADPAAPWYASRLVPLVADACLAIRALCDERDRANESAVYHCDLEGRYAAECDSLRTDLAKRDAVIEQLQEEVRQTRARVLEDILSMEARWKAEWSRDAD